MPRCVCCKRKNHLMMKCKWCNIDYCPKCITYEIHLCSNIGDMKNNYNKQNENALIRNRVDKVKIIKI